MFVYTCDLNWVRNSRGTHGLASFFVFTGQLSIQDVIRLTLKIVIYKLLGKFYCRASVGPIGHSV